MHVKEKIGKCKYCLMRAFCNTHSGFCMEKTESSTVGVIVTDENL